MRRVLLTPFKVRTVVETVAGLCAAVSAAQAAGRRGLAGVGAESAA